MNSAHAVSSLVATQAATNRSGDNNLQSRDGPPCGLIVQEIEVNSLYTALVTHLEHVDVLNPHKKLGQDLPTEMLCGDFRCKDSCPGTLFIPLGGQPCKENEGLESVSWLSIPDLAEPLDMENLATSWTPVRSVTLLLGGSPLRSGSKLIVQ